LEEGRLAHALLQHLPELPPEHRRAAAESLLARRGALTPERRDELVARAIHLLELPELAPLFAPGSRAEVAVAGMLARPGAPTVPFSGRVDRLAVTADALLLADFKTGPTPAADDHVAQLALYRAALTPLYPGLAFRAYLVGIDDATATCISARALDEAMERRLCELAARGRHEEVAFSRQ
jgi:ATP-dependent helicase/nuclease subunit A